MSVSAGKNSGAGGTTAGRTARTSLPLPLGRRGKPRNDMSASYGQPMKLLLCTSQDLYCVYVFDSQSKRLSRCPVIPASRHWPSCGSTHQLAGSADRAAPRNRPRAGTGPAASSCGIRNSAGLGPRSMGPACLAAVPSGQQPQPHAKAGAGHSQFRSKFAEYIKNASNSLADVFARLAMNLLGWFTKYLKGPLFFRRAHRAGEALGAYA